MPNQYFIPLIVAFDLLLVGTVASLLFRSSWKPLERSFPAREPSQPNVGRKFQSFSIGLVNYGGSIHVAIDDDCLHLTPIWLVARFGLKPVSIPWEAIRPLETPRSGRKKVRVQIGKQTITGPRWCFELLFPPAQREA